jgi:hypothetical protein
MMLLICDTLPDGVSRVRHFLSLNRVDFPISRRHKGMVQNQTRQRDRDHDRHRICQGKHHGSGPLDPGGGAPCRWLPGRPAAPIFACLTDAVLETGGGLLALQATKIQ